MLIEQYVFITIFFAAFAFFIYIHVAYPFWVHMPVSHTYDIHHRFYNSNINVLQQYPYKNKWISQKEVKTISYHDSTDACKTEVLDQLNCNYIPSDSILFTIEKKHLDVLFSGHFDTPFITTYYSSIGPLGKTTDKLEGSLGCIASYPVRILYRQEKTSANFMVFLACDRENPIKNEITRNLIATHEYNSRNRVTDIKISILKKHTGSCEGVRPLLTFSTHLYYIGGSKGTNPSKDPTSIKHPLDATLAPAVRVIQVYRQNWSLMQDIADLLPQLFEFCAYMDVAALKARVDAGQLWIFCIKHGRDIIAAYFIEDAMMLYEKVNDYGGKTLNLVASMCNMKKKSKVFYSSEGTDGSELRRSDGSFGPHAPFVKGFAECLAMIHKQNRDYAMLLMDDVGHNQILVKEMGLVPTGTVGSNGLLGSLEIVKTTGAYYMINGFVKEPVNANRAFMLI